MLFHITIFFKSKQLLKKDLNEKPKNWNGCNDPVEDIYNSKSYKDEISYTTTYGIHKKTQELLSSIRTDLDAFHEIEAMALMYSGYNMTKSSYKIEEDNTYNRELWNFLEVEKNIKDYDEREKVNELLKISSSPFFKSYQINNTFLYKTGIVTTMLVFLIVMTLVHFWGSTIVEIKGSNIIKTIVTIIILFAIGKTASSIFNWKSTLIKMTSKLLLVLGSWIFSNYYLKFLNPYYLKVGRYQYPLEKVFSPNISVKIISWALISISIVFFLIYIFIQLISTPLLQNCEILQSFGKNISVPIFWNIIGVCVPLIAVFIFIHKNHEKV